MVAYQLGMRIAQRIVSTISREKLSEEKLYNLLAVRLIKARDLTELIQFDPDPRRPKISSPSPTWQKIRKESG